MNFGNFHLPEEENSKQSPLFFEMVLLLPRLFAEVLQPREVASMTIDQDENFR